MTTTTKPAQPCDAELWVMAGKYPAIPAQLFIDVARDVLNKFGAGQAVESGSVPAALREIAGWMDSGGPTYHEAELIGMNIAGPTGCGAHKECTKAAKLAFLEAARIWERLHHNAPASGKPIDTPTNAPQLPDILNVNPEQLIAAHYRAVWHHARAPLHLQGATHDNVERVKSRLLEAISNHKDDIPVEMKGIAETLADGDHFWRSCSGCHESNEGMATGPFSKTLKCHLGVGCSECGGIGAIWDTTDYDAMADFMAAKGQQNAGITETVACGCGDMFPASSYGAGFIAAAGHCENCDAAQGADADKVDAEPDMFWNADNPEQCKDSIHNLLVEVQCDRTLRVGGIVEVQQAMSLPNISVRITAVDGEDDDGDLKYEIVNDAAIDAARKEQAR